MKKALLIILLALPVAMYGQGNCYVYHIFWLNELSNCVRVSEDNGREVDFIRNGKGKPMEFYTKAGVLMYLISRGWELYTPLQSDENDLFISNGFGKVNSSTYWVMRKHATKEEFDKAVDNAIKK